jgi:hypothetical protein
MIRDCFVNWRKGQNRFYLAARGMRRSERVQGRGRGQGGEMAQCMHI